MNCSTKETESDTNANLKVKNIKRIKTKAKLAEQSKYFS